MQIQYSTMNKGRVNRNSSANVVTVTNNKNDNETDASTTVNIKKEVSEIMEKKEIGSGDTKQQKSTFNETYQKSTNNRRKCFPSKHKQQLLQSHVTSRDFNSVYKANGSGGMDLNKISTGTMTVPSMTFYSPHFNAHQDNNNMVSPKQKGMYFSHFRNAKSY